MLSWSYQGFTRFAGSPLATHGEPLRGSPIQGLLSRCQLRGKGQPTTTALHDAPRPSRPNELRGSVVECGDKRSGAAPLCAQHPFICMTPLIPASLPPRLRRSKPPGRDDERVVRISPANLSRAARDTLPRSPKPPIPEIIGLDISVLSASISGLKNLGCQTCVHVAFRQLVGQGCIHLLDSGVTDARWPRHLDHRTPRRSRAPHGLTNSAERRGVR